MIGDFLPLPYWAWLLDGFLVTILLSALVSACALLLGFVLCMARLSTVAVLVRSVTALLSVLRNTPLLVQLFIWYFGVSALLPDSWMVWLNQPHRLGFTAFGFDWPTFEILAGFVGLTLYTAAFMAEEFRAGVNSLPSGQVLAARALGLADGQIWRCVILPQAVRIALPPLAGQVMNVVKNSSLTMTIGLAELSYQARRVETETFQAFQAFGVATVFYIILIAIIGMGARWVEMRWAVAR